MARETAGSLPSQAVVRLQSLAVLFKHGKG